MRKKIPLLIIFNHLLITFSFSQGVDITSWKVNTTGHKAQYYDASYNLIDLNDSSEVQEVCYNTDTIYIRANSLGNFVMGPWPGDPFLADGQNYSYVFPRNPSYPSSTHPPIPTGMCGLWVNGVAMYTAGDGKSYKFSTGMNTNNGDGLWNTIAWMAHGDEMDDGGGHPDPNNVYHNHSNPYELYDENTSVHSPIIGWAFDGFPVYGPFGYTDPLDATSAVKRIEVSYQLRSITDRNSTSPAGPSLAAFPLGYYIEDYEYVSSSGDLDQYNGRYCVTPEYPAGTYAYFLGTNSDGSPTYPNFLATNYYGGTRYLVNFGVSGGNASKPTVGASCYEPLATRIVKPTENQVQVIPNPSSGAFTVSVTNLSNATYVIYNAEGREVKRGNIKSLSESITLEEGKGLYTIYVLEGENSYKSKIVIY